MKPYLSLFLLLLAIPAHAQGIFGRIIDERMEAVPFANLFVPTMQTGGATNADGEYNLLLPPGNYELIISCVGYTTKKVEIAVLDTLRRYDFVVETQSTELGELTVRASKKDPAYEIMQLAIENRERFRVPLSSFRSQIYVKASEFIENMQQAAPPTAEEPQDPSAQALAQTQKRLLSSVNMVEMELTLNFQAPNLYKEERTAYQSYGTKAGLLLPTFGETDFNFYDNMVYLKGIADAPIISPISRTAILTYKFKWEEAVEENGLLVHKIKVQPRNAGGYSSVSGYIYINDSLWNINRIEVALAKGAARLYDRFQIAQAYQEVHPGIWLPSKQELTYETDQGHKKRFKGQTLIAWKSLEANCTFPPKFFGQELASTASEAYERDSAYWQQVRTEPLKAKEQQMVAVRDSIERAHSDPAYRDSIEARYNRVTINEVLLSGMGFRKEASKRHIYLGPLVEMVGFSVIGGFRLGPYASYSRQFRNGRVLSTNGHINMGLRNADLQGSGSLFFRYHPFKQGDVRLSAGRNFQSINPFDAYLNQLKISNYILQDYASASHRIELFNGFYVSVGGSFRNRYSVDGFDTRPIFPDIVGETEALPFKRYQAFISDFSVSYTPAQRYMREPNRKVVLGSRWPTFSIHHRKGWAGISDVDFDYWEAGLEHNLILGTLGNTKYTAKLGTFTNTRNLRFVDAKRFRQSDPYLYSDPLHSFQLLDTALTTSKVFFEVHHIHHFNGAFLNSIPLIKKTRVGLVAGAGFMWAQESNFRHEEVFGGLERTFKLGARRRLRLGLYGVVSQSNQRGFNQGFKISFDVIDAWKKDWSF